MSEGENSVSRTIEINNSKTIKDIYINNLKEDIKAKLKDNGYDVRSINIVAKDNESYTLENIEISVNNIKVVKGKIQIDDIVLSKNEKVTDEDEIKNYIASEYNVEKDIISIK